MKSKTIKAVINKKIKEWIETIDNDEVKKMVERDVIVTGGCITSMLLNEKVNDFDVYFRTKETTKEVAKYYTKKFIERMEEAGRSIPLVTVKEENDRISIYVASAGIVSETENEDYQYFETVEDELAAGSYVSDVMGEDIINDPGEIEDLYEETKDEARSVEDKKYRPVFLSTNAITLSNKIQIVIRFYGNPDEIHENYDFVHCTNYWENQNKSLVLRQEALEAILTKELRYVGSKYPVCSIMRIRKFVNRGWTINAGQILKMIMQINELDLQDVNVLKEQLTGVDVAYFNEIIRRLEEKGTDKLDMAYLMEIIERMF